ncbi:hypothetical protein Cpir12675_004802 [Ceratocystis pirilliformis]|uniref:Uncharacterized protein n=1 Tax=Ceratocystis pirilliformis TaxID=259994 RepID=A0ABR3YUL6_9PEZI
MADHPDRVPPPGTTRTRAVGTSGIRRNLFTGSVARRPTSSSTESSASAASANDENARLAPALGSVSNGNGNSVNMTRYSNAVASTPTSGPATVGISQFGNVLEPVQSGQLVVRDKNGEVHIPDTTVDDEADLALQERADKENELLAEVKASLRNRVAALEDDEWMFVSTKNIHR